MMRRGGEPVKRRRSWLLVAGRCRSSALSAASASACGLPDTEVAEAFRTLAAGHVIVLLPNSVDLWAAPPFSTAPTGFCVRSGGQTWFAVCAWEAFGIPAALGRDAVIEAACGWS